MARTTNPNTDETFLPEDENPELAGPIDSGPEGIGRASGSPNMEPDVDSIGNDDSLGNNDGTEPDPTITDEDTTF